MSAGSTGFRKSIFSFYLYTFLRSADVKRGVFILYWLQLGLSNTEIGILQTALFWSGLLAEIPSGIFADRISRRASLVVGCLLRALNGLGYLFFDGFFPFLILSVISGAGMAFFTGADQAYLYDVLERHGMSAHYNRFQARSKAIAAAALAGAIVAGGFLQAASYQWVFGVFLALMLLGAAVGAFMLEGSPAPRPQANPANSAAPAPVIAKQRFWVELREFFSSAEGKTLALLIGALGIYEAAYTPYFIFSQSLFQSLLIPAQHTASLLALVELGTALSYWLTSSWVEKLDFRKTAYFTLIATSLLLTLNLLNNAWVSAFGFLAAMLVPTVFFVASEGYIQSRIPSSIRSTFFSISSTFQSLTVSLSYLALGRLMDKIPEGYAIAWLAVLPATALFLLAGFFSRAKRGEKPETGLLPVAAPALGGS